MPPDYLLLGHLARDLLPDGTAVPGGTALYAALAAQRLGRRAGVVSARAELPGGWPTEIAIAFHASPTPPTFENRYTAHGRQQILHADSRPMAAADIPAGWRGAPIIHLCPVLHETPEQFIQTFRGALLGVTPQGWMRRWGTPLPAPVTYQPWRPAPATLASVDALILSVEDIGGDEALAEDYARHCPLVALTRGAAGATLFVRGQPHQIAPFPATERDPTGAGDVFATALLVRLAETGAPLEAARFAACAAAISVEGDSTSRVPTRAEVERRLGSHGVPT